MTTPPVLEAVGITKRFPGVLALNDVSFTVRSGEIHALVGENGAGKSTLIKVLTGIYSPDEGSVAIDGSPAHLRSARDAVDRGIALVPQERTLIPAMSVAENILLGRQPLRRGLLDLGEMKRQAGEWFKMLDVDLDLDRTAGSLSVGEAQLVEIARALALESRILILDEPTASLPPSDVDGLFEVLRGLRDRGVGLVFVSHKEPELFELCDRVTVLRDGEVTLGDKALDAVTSDQLMEAMVGRTVDLFSAPERTIETGTPAIELRGVSTADGHEDIDLSLSSGEVLGLYGLVGSGRTELAKAIIGEVPITEGIVEVAGVAVVPKSPRVALQRDRIGYISEDRRREGLILSHPIYSNIVITVWRRLAGFAGFLTQGTEREAAEPIVKELGVRARNSNQLVQLLSGGNQQKVSIGKWLEAEADVLIFDEPTIGIDIPTKQQIHQLMWSLTESGRSILLISSDLPELVQVSDRVMVMAEYRIVGEFQNSHDYEEMSQRMMQSIQAASHLHVSEGSDG